MKGWKRGFSSLIVAGGLVIGSTGVGVLLNPGTPAYAAADAVDSVQQNTISVTGKGEITVKPDVAYVSLGVETNAATAKDAQSNNAAAIQKLTGVLKNTWHISAADIQTVQFTVQPNYTYTSQGTQKLNGYVALHTLNVKYNDLSSIGKLLDSAATAGANKLNSVTFTVENPDPYQEQVINKAMENAKLKANAIAKAAGRQLGSVLSVSQNDAGDMPLYLRAELASPSQQIAADSASTAIEPGQITVKMTLSVLHSMK